MWYGVVYDWQQARETRYSALKVILEDNIRLRDKAEERFQTLFEREIHRLHNGVREESEVRICMYIYIIYRYI